MEEANFKVPVQIISCDIFPPNKQSAFFTVLEDMSKVLSNSENELIEMARDPDNKSIVEIRGARLELCMSPSEKKEHQREALAVVLAEAGNGWNPVQFERELTCYLINTTGIFDCNWQTLSIVFSCGDCPAQPKHIDFRIPREIKTKRIRQIGLMIAPGGTTATQHAASQKLPIRMHNIWPHFSQEIKDVGDGSEKVRNLIQEIGALFLPHKMAAEKTLEFGTVVSLQCNAIHCAPATKQPMRAVMFGAVVPADFDLMHGSDTQWLTANSTCSVVVELWLDHCEQLLPEHRMELMKELFLEVFQTLFKDLHANFSSTGKTVFEEMVKGDPVMKEAHKKWGEAPTMPVALEEAREFTEIPTIQKLILECSQNSKLFDDCLEPEEGSSSGNEN